MTLQVAPGDGFFATQRTVIWLLPTMNLHVALCVVCGCMVFAIYIPYLNLMSMNNMSLQYIFHFPFPVTFFTLFLVLQFFVVVINLTAMTSQQKLNWSFLYYLKSTLGHCFNRICCVNPFSGEFVQLH